MIYIELIESTANNLMILIFPVRFSPMSVDHMGGMGGVPTSSSAGSSESSSGNHHDEKEVGDVGVVAVEKKEKGAELGIVNGGATFESTRNISTSSCHTLLTNSII